MQALSKFAYSNTATLAANTANAGLEIEIPLVALSSPAIPVTVGSPIDLFAAYTNGDGGFFTDVLPAIVGRTATLGTDPNFATIPGNKSITYVLGESALSSQAAVANGFDFRVYPNPAQAGATVAYTVPGGSQPVALAVYNILGQRVQALGGGLQAGRQQVALGHLPAGAYLVRLQIGDQRTSQKMVVE